MALVSRFVALSLDFGTLTAGIILDEFVNTLTAFLFVCDDFVS
jgi:hypothetical protein